MAEPTTPRAAAASEDKPTPLRKTTTSSSNSTPRSPGERRNSLGQLVRTASWRLIDANPPGGMWSATGQLASKAPTMSELRGSSYSSNRSRRQSQPLESPKIADDERAPSRISISDIGDTPFMTPLQTPLAIVNSEYMSEPDPIETTMTGNQTPKRAVPEKTPKPRSTKDSDGSDDTIQESMAGDEDLAPALAVISQGDFQEQSEPASKRNSVVEKRKSVKATDPTKRTSFLARLIRGKDSSTSDEKEREESVTEDKGKENVAPKDRAKDNTSDNKAKESIIPVVDFGDDLPEELNSQTKRRSKNLDKFFGENINAAVAPEESKRNSKNLDKFFGEDTSKVVPQPTVAKVEQRRTRDFADMVEGDDADFPELLFGRNDMPTQSYDASQRKPRAPKPVEEAKKEMSKPSTRTTEAPSTVAVMVEEKQVVPQRESTEKVPHSDGEESEEDEEDIDWDEFMRGIDERPPRRGKHASKDMSKFFGEDPSEVGREPSPAVAAAENSTTPPPHEGSVGTEEKRKRLSRPLSALSIDRLSQKNGTPKSSTPRNVTPSPRRGPTSFQQEPEKKSATGLEEMRATAQPAEGLAATEAEAEKAIEVGAGADDEDDVYPTGYRLPPKKTAWQGFLTGLKAFAKFTFTPLGFLVVIYGLLVVAWGGMLFLLLCNAAPAMCQLGNGRFDCNDINSPRRIWVEIDSQILNALFCVTGFGLIPWRFRDWYFLLRWRLAHDEKALRRLCGWHSGWFRLPGSDAQPVPKPLPHDRTDLAAVETNAAYPLPAARAPLLPLTGRRAPATAPWKLDFVVWAFVINTMVQACLSGAMWGLNRYNRPSWVTGFLVALAMLIAMAGGIMQFVEGRRIKRIEGVPWDDGDEMNREMDRELGLATGSRDGPAGSDDAEKEKVKDDKKTKKGLVNGKAKAPGKTEV